MNCNCKSYNLGGGTTQEVILNLPDNIDVGKKNRTVCVDACIAEVIKHLWSKGYQSLGCCCGHGKGSPSIVITNGYNNTEILAILLEISRVDDRDWDIFQWKLMKVNGLFKG